MTVSSQTSNETFFGNGVTVTWPLPFRFFDNSDVRVSLISPSTQTVTPMVLGTDYTISGAGLPEQFGTAPGTITTTTPVALGNQLYVERVMPVEQLTDIINQGEFFPEVHEDVFDRLTMLIQQNSASIVRALTKPIGKEYYDALGLQIKNLANPTAFQDAATMGWAETYIGSLLQAAQGNMNLAQNVIYTQPGGVPRAVSDTLADEVYFNNMGGVPDYFTDNRAALIAADQYCYENGKTLVLQGNYGMSDGMIRKANWVTKSLAPTLGTFPISADDKIYMRPGFKHRMPGTSLWFKGTGTQVATTARSDRFSSFTYAVMDDPVAMPKQIVGIAFIQDMDVYDAAGNLTSVANDNRAHYDVGHYRACGWGYHSNLVTFGYWEKDGTLVYGPDIDYNYFDGACSSSGDIGVAICGNGVTGLSGTIYDGRMFANDHHSRSIVDNQWGTTALYIDGAIPTASPPQNSVGGHYFRGSIRTYCDNPFILDHCNTVVFDGCVFEWPILAGSTGATKSLPIGTANTYGVVFNNCRHLSPIGVDGIYQFANSIGGVFIHSDPRHGNLGVAYAGVGGFIRANGGNPSFQLTTDINGSTKGWTKVMNLGSSNRLEDRYENATLVTLTTAGTLTATRLVAVLTGSSSAADPSVRLSGSDASSGFYRPGANNIAVSIAGTKVADWQADGHLRPGADNTYSLGSGSFRWSQLFAATGTINTSDERTKDIRGELTPEEMQAWSKVRGLIFQFKDAISVKGAGARMHAGYSAQAVQQAFLDAGLNPADYGLWCENEIRTPVTKTRKGIRQKFEQRETRHRKIVVVDGKAVSTWEYVNEPVPAFDAYPMIDENGNPIMNGDGEQQMHLEPVMEEYEEEYEDFEPAGMMMGLRYEECAIFECAYLRSELAAVKQRLKELESL